MTPRTSSKFNVQAGKRNKILLAHVQRICEAHDTVMRSYYQQIQKWLLNETSHLNEWQSFENLEIFGFWREFWRIVRTRLEYIHIPRQKNRPCRGQLHCMLAYVKDIVKTRVVWGWREDVDGEHWRTSVCVNNSQGFVISCWRKVKTGQSLSKMSKPTVLHTEGTAQVSE